MSGMSGNNPRTERRASHSRHSGSGCFVQNRAVQDRQYPKVLVINDGVDFEKVDALFACVRQIGIHCAPAMKAFFKIPKQMSWPFGKPGNSGPYRSR